jgi:hypothetical protein
VLDDRADGVTPTAAASAQSFTISDFVAESFIIHA